MDTSLGNKVIEGVGKKKNLNAHFAKAKKNKSNEFYTQLTDIEKELQHYSKHFKGKVVLCNCDDPRVSNFFHYFSHSFEKLGLKKLITTCYKNKDINSFSKNQDEKAVWLSYEGDKNGNRVPDAKEIGVKRLKGDGDFRSEECINLLKEADIVVTNPPFSLFRKYVAQLIKYKKKFLIIGHQNALTYKETFSLVQRNKIWLGVDNGGTKWFRVQDHYDIATESRKKIEKGVKYFSMGSVVWFTNLKHKKRKEDLILYKEYSPGEYPKYDNYDAINVDKVADIPKDYKGVTGVPITFIDKYNPDQFEIIGNEDSLNIDKGRGYINGERKYGRIFIRRK